MTFAQLVAALGDLAVDPAAVVGDGAHPVSGVAYDSRAVEPGHVFVALKGLKHDGLQFVPQAIARGAAVVVSEEPRAADAATPWIRVRDGRLALARLGAAMHGHPSREIPVVGVTGTNFERTIYAL